MGFHQYNKMQDSVQAEYNQHFLNNSIIPLGFSSRASKAPGSKCKEAIMLNKLL